MGTQAACMRFCIVILQIKHAVCIPTPTSLCKDETCKASTKLLTFLQARIPRENFEDWPVDSDSQAWVEYGTENAKVRVAQHMSDHMSGSICIMSQI